MFPKAMKLAEKYDLSQQKVLFDFILNTPISQIFELRKEMLGDLISDEEEVWGRLLDVKTRLKSLGDRLEMEGRYRDANICQLAVDDLHKK